MCSDAPDYSGMNRAAEQNAQISAEQLVFARQQAANAEKRQAAFDPKFAEILEASLASQKNSDARSEEQWQQYLKIGMPAENRLAETAANYDTVGRRDEAAAAARAGVEREGAAAREAQNRTLGRAGVSLSSGRALTLDNASRLTQAKASAGAAQAARDKVEATGMSLTDNVAKFGRGLTSTGLQAAQLALQGGSQAGNTLGQQQSTYNASLAPAMQGYGGAASSSASAGSIYGQVAGLQQQANQSSLSGLAGLGSLVGTLGSAGTGSIAGSLLLSSRDFKTKTGDVDGKAARQSLEGAKVERWKYKDGIADGGEHIGRYAEDIPGGPMGGKAIDVISELGLHHAAIADMSKELGEMRATLSLGGPTGSERPTVRPTSRTLGDAQPTPRTAPARSRTLATA